MMLLLSDVKKIFPAIMIEKIIVLSLSPPAANEQAGEAAEGDDEGGDEAATSTWLARRGMFT
jgi:hypothetical protein